MSDQGNQFIILPTTFLSTEQEPYRSKIGRRVEVENHGTVVTLEFSDGYRMRFSTMEVEQVKVKQA